MKFLGKSFLVTHDRYSTILKLTYQGPGVERVGAFLAFMGMIPTDLLCFNNSFLVFSRATVWTSWMIQSDSTHLPGLGVYFPFVTCEAYRGLLRCFS
jgi:hypothetical protein